MTEQTVARTPSAYAYPLLIRQLLEAPLVDAPDQQIVYRGQLRFSYRQFRERVYADKGFVSKHALLLRAKFVEAIDKTGVGKTNKVELRKKHL